MEKEIKFKVQESLVAYKVLVYFFLGILWSFANVGYSIGFLTWFALVPYLFIVRNENLKNGVLYSWIFGITAYLTHFWWMMNPFLTNFVDVFPGAPQIVGAAIGTVVLLFVSIYHGLIYVAIYIIVKYIVTKKRGDIFYIVYPVVFTVVDYFFPKLWYDQIGYSQYIFLNFSQIADLFGASTITFIVVSCNAAIIILIESVIHRKDMSLGLFLCGVVLLMIISSSIYGSYRIKQIEKLTENAPKARIAIIQGNIDGVEKRDGSKLNKMIETYNELTKTVLADKPDLVIWPESAIPTLIDENMTDYSFIKKFDKVPLIMGTQIYESTGKKTKAYNSLVLLSADSQAIEHYNKIKLLPFIEGVPIPYLDSIMNLFGLDSFGQGKGAVIMTAGKINAAVNICYEDLIPVFIRDSLKTKDKKANVIINATNDSWFGKSIEPNMHMHIAGFRSIENRISLVRATCTGYSVVFTPDGKISYKSELFVKAAKVVEVPLVEIDTFYKKGGYLFVYFLGSIILAVFIFALYRKLKFNLKKSKIIGESHHAKFLKSTWLD